MMILTLAIFKFINTQEFMRQLKINEVPGNIEELNIEMEDDWIYDELPQNKIKEEKKS